MCRLKPWIILLIQLLSIHYVVSLKQSVSCSDESFQSDINKKFIEELESSMNINADPCEDFYEYACGNWTENLSFLENVGTVFARLQLQDKEAQTSLNKAYKKALLYYNTCSSTCTYDLMEFLKLVGPAPQQKWPLYKSRTSKSWNFEKFVWWKVLAKLQSYKMQLIFNIRAGVVAGKSDLNIIGIGKNNASNIIDLSKDLLVDMGYNTSVKRKLFKWKLQAYGKKIQNILAGKNDADKTSNETMCNMEKYYEIIESVEYDNGTELMNLNELQSLLPSVEWQTYFDIYFQGTNIKLPENAKLFTVYNIAVLRRLIQFLANSSKETLALYLMANFLNHINSTLPDLDAQAPFCIYTLFTLMPLVANRLHEDFYYGPTRFESDEVINNIFKDMKTKLNELFEQNRLNLMAKEIDYLKRKNQKMRLNIGNLPENKTIEFLSDYYADLNINVGHNFYHNHLELLRHNNLQQYRHLIAEHANETNVFRTFDYRRNPFNSPGYIPFLNMIVFTFNSLTFPFYHHKSHHIFHSTIRLVLSHEMMHGFDTYGIKFDHNGEYNFFMGIIAKKKSYMDGVECLKKYITAGIGERIADVAGLRLTIDTVFNELPIYVRESKTRATTLSYRKIFFVKIWQYFCQDRVEGVVDLAADVHDPHDYRMIYALANTREFLDEFKCTKEMTPISSEEVCQLW